VTAGNLPVKRPDQWYRRAAAALGAGGAAGILRATKLIISGTAPPGSGEFVYSPTVGSNNLIWSVASQTGTDGTPGNAVLGGGTVYFTDGAGHYFAISMNPAQRAIEYYEQDGGEGIPGGGTGTWLPQFGLAISNLAGAGTVYGLDESNVPIAAPPACWNAALRAIDPVALNTPETWHAMTLASGWTNTGGTDVTAQYKLTTDNAVWIVGDVSHASFSGSLNIATLPAQYSPAHDLNSDCATVGVFHFRLQTTGALSAEQAPAGTTRVIFNERFPLDA
jgi:hypothetical protein